jgi:hypothetical protein
MNAPGATSSTLYAHLSFQEAEDGFIKVKTQGKAGGFRAAAKSL